MELQLLHGRVDPDQDMQDWGFDGPRITGITRVHGTYMTTFTVGFLDREAMRQAQKQTGWKEMGSCILAIDLHDDLVKAAGYYYGDFEILPDGRCQ